MRCQYEAVGRGGQAPEVRGSERQRKFRSARSQANMMDYPPSRLQDLPP